MKKQERGNWLKLKGLAKDRERQRMDEKPFVRIPASQPLSNPGAHRQNANHFKHFRAEIVAIASGISTSQPIHQIS